VRREADGAALLPIEGSGEAEDSAGVQQRARSRGIPGIYGNVGILESATYRI